MIKRLSTDFLQRFPHNVARLRFFYKENNEKEVFPIKVKKSDLVAESQKNPELKAKEYLDRASIQEIAKMKQDLTGMVEQYDRDDVLASYEEDLEIEAKNKFAGKLAVRDRLLDLREMNEKNEKQIFAVTSGIGAIVCSILMVGFLIVLNKWHRIWPRSMAYLSFCRMMWLANKKTGTDKELAVVEACSSYIEVDSKEIIKNGVVSLKILECQPGIEAENLAQVVLHNINHAKDDLLKFKKLYVKQLGNDYVIDSLSRSLFNLSKNRSLREHNKAEIASCLKEILMAYAPVEAPSEIHFLKKLRYLNFYVPLQAFGISLPFFEELLESSIKECMRRVEEHTSAGSFDKAIINVTVEKYLLDKLQRPN